MSTEGSPIIQETIQLDVKLSQDKGLAALVAQLEQVKRAAQQADAALAKTTGTKPTLNAKGLEDEIKKLQKGVGGKPLALTLPDLSKAFDVHLGQWREFIGKNKELQKEFKSLQAETLRSAPAASRLLYAFQEHQARGRQADLARLQTPTVASVHAAPLGVDSTQKQPVLPTAKPVKPVNADGPVKVQVLGGQVQASVEGVVKLIIPASQIVASAEGGAGGGGGRDPATGRILPGGGSGGGGGDRKNGKKGKYGPLDVPPQTGEFGRKRIEDASGHIRETVSRRDAAGALVDETWDNAQNAVRASRTVRRSVTGESPLQEFKRLRALRVEEFRKEVAESADGGQGGA